MTWNVTFEPGCKGAQGKDTGLKALQKFSTARAPSLDPNGQRSEQSLGQGIRSTHVDMSFACNHAILTCLRNKNTRRNDGNTLTSPCPAVEPLKNPWINPSPIGLSDSAHCVTLGEQGHVTAQGNPKGGPTGGLSFSYSM